MTCSKCGEDHYGRGCKLPWEPPPPPTAWETQRRLDYLDSTEFKRISDDSLAGRNPSPESDPDTVIRTLRAKLEPRIEVLSPPQRPLGTCDLMDVLHEQQSGVLACENWRPV